MINGVLGMANGRANDAITSMALSVAPFEPTNTAAATEGEKTSYARQHRNLVTSLRDHIMSKEEASKATLLTEGLIHLLQMRHHKKCTQRLGEWACAPLDEGSGELHKLLKGGQGPIRPTTRYLGHHQQPW